MKLNTDSNDRRFELLWRLLRRHIIHRSRVANVNAQTESSKNRPVSIRKGNQPL